MQVKVPCVCLEAFAKDADHVALRHCSDSLHHAWTHHTCCAFAITCIYAIACLALALALVNILVVGIRTPVLNRSWHLQAFRHLYVLASEPRCVDAVDVHTHERVYVPLQIRLRPGTSPGQAPPGPPTLGAGGRIRHEDLLDMGRPTWYPVCSAPPFVSHNIPCLHERGYRKCFYAALDSNGVADKWPLKSMGKHTCC